MRTTLVVGLALTVLLSFTACDDGTTPTLGNTPAQVLRSLIYAFNSRNIGTLGNALVSDFTFYFDEDDVGKQIGDYVIPESWGKDEFTVVAGYMFEQAHTIEMEIDTSNVGAPGDDDNIYFARDIEVRLLVMVDAVNGYLADGVCDFEFVDVESGEPDNWVISNWQDRTWPTVSGGRNVTPASVGFILAVFD